MLKILIADDEPLVQAGIKSMINWEKHDMTIVGIASNGQIAYDLIREYEPDIVITDIKMPVMTGLQLAKKCYQEKRDLPVFIILTSYEEFSYAKEAVQYQVSDYLIKLELTPDTLERSLEKAAERVRGFQKTTPEKEDSGQSLSLLKDRFFMRLIQNLFDSEEQLSTEISRLNLDFSAPGYLASYLEISSDRLSLMNHDQQLLLYTSCLQMIRELIPKYLDCYVLSLDTRHFCIIFYLKQMENYRADIENAIRNVSSMLFNYYSVKLLAAFGNPVSDPSQIFASYHDARQIFSMVSKEQPAIFFSDVNEGTALKNVFNISLFRKPLQKAFSDYDKEELQNIFHSITDLFVEHPSHSLQAMDAAANILFLSLSFLNNGEQAMEEIFADYPDGYRSLYNLNTTGQILDWLGVLEDGICLLFDEHSKDSKHHIVTNVKKYIQEHLNEKLSLNSAADHFNISPNYLSTLFSKYSDLGFNDYVNQQKVEAAKKMILDGELKIYEISELLGFESAFYFSRVFKKVTGISPRDFINQQI